jgi:hypothetical protein
MDLGARLAASGAVPIAASQIFITKQDSNPSLSGLGKSADAAF